MYFSGEGLAAFFESADLPWKSVSEFRMRHLIDAMKSRIF